MPSHAYGMPHGLPWQVLMAPCKEYKKNTLLSRLVGNISRLVETCLLKLKDFSLKPEAGWSFFGRTKRVSFSRFFVSWHLLFETGVEKITPTLKWWLSF